MTTRQQLFKIVTLDKKLRIEKPWRESSTLHFSILQYFALRTISSSSSSAVFIILVHKKR